jgi:hypothetical protein
LLVRDHSEHACSTGLRARSTSFGARLLCCLPGGLGARHGCLGEADLFDELFKQGQAKNGAMKTLTASFVETTSSTLLTKPLVSSGTLAVVRPSRIVLRYTQPTSVSSSSTAT